MKIRDFDRVIHRPTSIKSEVVTRQKPSEIRSLVIEDIMSQLNFASKLDQQLCLTSLKKGLKISKSSGESLRVKYTSTALATTSSNSPSTKVLNKTDLFEELIGSNGDVFIRNGHVSHGDRHNPIPQITKLTLNRCESI